MEEQLIYKSKNGDPNAFALIVDKYTSYLFSVVFRIVNVEEEAKDIVQETFIAAWQNLNKYDSSKSKLTTWLYTIATRMAFDVLRKRKEQVELTDAVFTGHSGCVSAQMDNNEMAELIKSATKSLSPMQKVVFVLRDIESMEVSEVCEITGWSAKQIKDNLYVARKQIRERLKRLVIE